MRRIQRRLLTGFGNQRSDDVIPLHTHGAESSRCHTTRRTRLSSHTPSLCKRSRKVLTCGRAQQHPELIDPEARATRAINDQAVVRFLNAKFNLHSLAIHGLIDLAEEPGAG